MAQSAVCSMGITARATCNIRCLFLLSHGSFGITNPLERWEYTVYEDGVETCVDIWIPPFMTSDLVEAYLSLILTVLSIACLTVTLITYLIFAVLRNLPGLNLMALALTTLTYQITFLSGVNERTAVKEIACTAIAIFIHFLILASFFWTNVMAWDIYKTFGRKTLFTRVRPKRYFVRYLLYSYGSPFLIVSFALMCEYSDIIPGFQVGYGEYSCWIGNVQVHISLHSIHPFCINLEIPEARFLNKSKFVPSSCLAQDPRVYAQLESMAGFF